MAATAFPLRTLAACLTFGALFAQTAHAGAPTVPTGLSANAASGTVVALNWNASTATGTGVGGYRIFRNGSSIATTTNTSYSDTGASSNTAYVYAVAAYDTTVPANESLASPTVSVTTLVTPASPGGMVYQCNDGGANGRLVVDANSIGRAANFPFCTNMVAVALGSAGITLQRWHPTDPTDPFAAWQPLANLPNDPPAGWYLWTPLGWQTLAQVQGGGGGGGGGGDTTAPSVPTGLAANAVSSSQINLSWNASTDNSGGTGIGGYRIVRTGPGSTTTTINTVGVGTTYNDTGLVASTLYSYTVAAVDLATPTANVSGASGQASATTQAAAGTAGQVYQCNDAGANHRLVIDTNTIGRTPDFPNCANMVAVPFAGAGITLQRWHPTDPTDPFAAWQTVAELPAGWFFWTPNGWQTLAQVQGGGGGGGDTTAPSVPTGLAANAVSSSQINLSWNASTDNSGGTGIGGYRIVRTGPGSTTTTINTVGVGTTYNDTGLVASTLYSYTVAAVDLATPTVNVSGASGQASATTQAGGGGGADTTPPSVPTGLTAGALSSSSIQLSWNASTDNAGGTGVGGYRVFRNGNSVGTTTATTFADVGLFAGTPYSYTVAAFDLATPANESAQSGAANASTLSGGGGGGGPQNWTWMNGPQLSWGGGSYGTQGQASPGNVPGGRSGASTWYDNAGYLWMFGGYGIDGTYNFGQMNDVWKYNLGTNQWTWVGGSNVHDVVASYGPVGANPGARATAASWSDNAGNLYIFGGIVPGGFYSLSSDLWRYNQFSGQWTYLKGPTSTFQKGNCGQQGVPDPANYPGARREAATWTDAAGNLWMFGGLGYDCFDAASAHHLNDLWRYQPSSGNWTFMGGSMNGNGAANAGTRNVPSTGNIPSARQEMGTWADQSGNLWLWGGEGQYSGPGNVSGTGNYNDLWRYNIAAGTWTWVSGDPYNAAQSSVAGAQGVGSPSNTPGGRRATQSWIDQAGNLWMMGGYFRTTDFKYFDYNDLWKYEPANGNWTWVNGSLGTGAPGVYGSLGVPSSNNVPGAREAGATWVDSSGHFWMFGGLGIDVNGGYGQINDMWRY